MGKHYDVIVAGAGPVGLFLACELGMAGVSVLVLERDEKPESLWKQAPLGRRGLFTPSVEAFYRRGMLAQVIGGGERKTHFEKTSSYQFAGHFAGIMLDGNKLDMSHWKYHVPGPAFLPGASTLEDIEVALSRRAKDLGVQIVRGAAVSSLVDEGEVVKVQTKDESFEAQWLVGCDGGRSFVRKAAGFAFEGTEAEFTGYATLCELEDPASLPKGLWLTKTGMYIVGSPGHVLAIDFEEAFDRSQPITQQHFQKVLRRVSGKDVTVKALHLASSFTDRSKQASQYRKGRILLAGDSAHIHSPLGAQGLSTGIADAMNLGWKLAGVVKGSAPPGLLDTYHQERHPVAARVLEWTRAQVSTIRPNAFGHAVADIMRDMINTKEGTTYFVDRMWGLSQRYEWGDTHPLVGCSSPDFEFVDGQRLGTKLERGHILIIDFENNASVAKFAERLDGKVDYIGLQAKDCLGLKALLVRPDGVVAWVTEEEPDLDALQTALSRWLTLPESSG